MLRKVPSVLIHRFPQPRQKTTRPTDKAQSLFDGGGLFLLIAPQKYTADGKPLPALKG